MSGCHITKVECLKIHKKVKIVMFDLLVHWSDGKKINLQKNYINVFDFLDTLKRAFEETPMPELKAAKWFESLWKAKKEQKKAVEEFFQKILSLPERISHEKEVWEFFCCSEESGSESCVQNVAAFYPTGNEYEFVDIESINYNTLSIKPKIVSVFEREPSDDSTSIYWVVAEYSKRKSGEVDLKEGAAISVLQRELSGWWFVHVEDTNEQGWAPASSLLPVDRNNLNNCRVSGPFGEFQALNDFEASQPDEVSCRKGEKVEVIEATLDGWWRVRCKDKVGRIPATNLEPLCNEKSRNSLYQQAGIYKKHSPPPRRNSKVSVEELYGKVNKFRKFAPAKTTDSPNKFDRFPEYTQVNLNRNISPSNCKPKEDVVQNRPPVPNKPSEDRDDDDDPFYINAAEDMRRPYINVELKSSQPPKLHEIKYYKAKTQCAPVVKHHGRPVLPVEVGDIVELRKEEADQIFAKIVRLATGACPDPREGWIPKNYFEPYEFGKPNRVGYRSVTCEPDDVIVVEPTTTTSHSASPAKSAEHRKPPDPANKPKPFAEVKPKPQQKHSDPGPNQHRTENRLQLSNALNERSAPALVAAVVNHVEHSQRCTSVGSAVQPEKVVAVKQNCSFHDPSSEREQFTVRKVSRTDCENIMLRSATQRQFVIRESTKVGHYALSVRSVDRIHHFPIELTSEKKYFIGKYNFDSLQDVIRYYKENPLFVLDDGTEVILDSSLET